jgi:hypothetical protein
MAIELTVKLVDLAIPLGYREKNVTTWPQKS